MGKFTQIMFLGLLVFAQTNTGVVSLGYVVNWSLIALIRGFHQKVKAHIEIIIVFLKKITTIYIGATNNRAMILKWVQISKENSKMSVLEYFGTRKKSQN